MIRQFYTTREKAEEMAPKYARQEKRTVFLHVSEIDRDQFQYSLRTSNDVINVNCDNILSHYLYINKNMVEKKSVERTAKTYDPNSPAGAQSLTDDPANDPSLVICPHCDDKAEDFILCPICLGNGEVSLSEYKAYKQSEKDEDESNS